MFSLALRNIVRQKTHTAMTLVAVVCGVIGLVLAGGWVNDIFIQLAEALIHSQSGHIQIYKKGFYAAGSRSPEKYLIADPEALKRLVSDSPYTEDVMARLNFAALINNGRSDLPVIGEGVEPSHEARLGTSLSMTAGRALAPSDSFGIVLGAGLANALKLKPGDRVTLLANTHEGALNTLDFEVIGIFQTFSNDYDARAVKIPLAAAQELIGTRGANAIVVTLTHTADTEKFVNMLRTSQQLAEFELKTWVELNDFYGKTVALYKTQFGFLQIIVLIMVLLSVNNSVNMSIFNRVGEFGTMMSLGNRRRDVSRLILAEGLMLGLIGAAVGVAFGIALALIISAIGIPMPPPPNANLGYTAFIRLTPATIAVAFAVGILATVFATLFPARRIARTPIVDALRANV